MQMQPTRLPYKFPVPASQKNQATFADVNLYYHEGRRLYDFPKEENGLNRLFCAPLNDETDCDILTLGHCDVHQSRLSPHLMRYLDLFEGCAQVMVERLKAFNNSDAQNLISTFGKISQAFLKNSNDEVLKEVPELEPLQLLSLKVPELSGRFLDREALGSIGMLRRAAKVTNVGGLVSRLVESHLEFAGDMEEEHEQMAKVFGQRLTFYLEVFANYGHYYTLLKKYHNKH